MSDERWVLEILAARLFAHSIFLLVFCTNFAVHIVFLFVISQPRICFHPTSGKFSCFCLVWCSWWVARTGSAVNSASLGSFRSQRDRIVCSFAPMTLIWIWKSWKDELLLSLEGLGFLFWRHIKLRPKPTSTMRVLRETGEKSKSYF